jgi:hypothetical protein
MFTNRKNSEQNRALRCISGSFTPPVGAQHRIAQVRFCVHLTGFDIIA